jgi:hypothetical protein
MANTPIALSSKRAVCVCSNARRRVDVRYPQHHAAAGIKTFVPQGAAGLPNRSYLSVLGWGHFVAPVSLVALFAVPVAFGASQAYLATD